MILPKQRFFLPAKMSGEDLISGLRKMYSTQMLI